jgi:hypothetical protein
LGPCGPDDTSEIAFEAGLVNHCKMVMAIREEMGLQ